MLSDPARQRVLDFAVQLLRDAHAPGADERTLLERARQTVALWAAEARERGDVAAAERTAAAGGNGNNGKGNGL